MKEKLLKAYQWLDGKKRRIAVLAGFMMTVTPPHTTVYKIANGVFILFGGADAVGVTKNYIDKKRNGR